MELLQLRYFQTTALLQHMSRAAEELSVSQPSLSKTIRTLENEIGVELFDRQGKYIRLNVAGQVFLKKVNAALSSLEDGVQTVRQMRERVSEQISLAFLAASPLLPKLLTAFRESHPGVEFHLLQHIGGSPKPNFDLCISTLPPDLENIQTMPLLTEEIFLAVPQGHPLAARSEINLREVANERFIHLKSNHALRRITDHYCEIAGFSPCIVFESDDAATVRGLINAGLGIGFIPAISWKGTIGSSVSMIRIKEPACSRSILLSWPQVDTPTDIVTQFRDFAIRFFQNL